MYDWFDNIFNTIQECYEYLDEAVKKKVIRKGKLVRKTFCKKGQKAKGGKCVPMKSTERVLFRSGERVKRKMKAKKGAIKRKAKSGRIKKKRAKAMKKRKTMGLK
jgi:hypothetical protein